MTAPALSQHGGTIQEGVGLEISAPQGVVFYTLDGSEPLLPDGSLGPTAMLFAAPISLSSDTLLKARTLDGEQWSALTEAAFFMPADVKIAEVHYHARPDEVLEDPDNPERPYDDDDFDFIELVNTGAETVDLDGLAFTAGITFSFAGGNVASLAPGQRVVVVRDEQAFAARYDVADMPIADEYSGRLDNNRETIRLSGSLGQTIAEVKFDEDWYKITDGDGYSLVLRDETTRTDDWNDPLLWRPSHFQGGSPGTADLGYGPNDVVFSEALTHNDGVFGDWLELHNTTDAPIDISGWFLSESSVLNAYTIHEGTILPADEYLVFAIMRPTLGPRELAA